MKLHSHAVARMRERGASDEEVVSALAGGERFRAKFGRNGFRRNIVFDGLWRGRRSHMTQVEVFAVLEDGDWLMISESPKISDRGRKSAAQLRS
jgi:hypothetical protein